MKSGSRLEFVYAQRKRELSAEPWKMAPLGQSQNFAFQPSGSSRHMAGPSATNFVKLGDIDEWYRDPVHIKLNKWFDAFAVIVKQVERIANGPKILLAVRDETVEEFKVLIDMSDWSDVDKYHEFNQDDIIFFKRAIVPSSMDVLVAAYISTFDLCPRSSTSASQASSLEVHQPPFRYWSPNHIIVANEAKCRRRIGELRDFVKNKTTPRKRKAEAVLRPPGSATSSRSISLDSSRLSFAFNPNDDEASKSPTTTKSPPLKSPRISSTPKSKGSQTPSKAQGQRNSSQRNSSTKSSRPSSVRRQIIDIDSDTTDDDATIVGSSSPNRLSTESEGDLTIIENGSNQENVEDSDEPRPLKIDLSSPNESFQTAASPTSQVDAEEIISGEGGSERGEIFEDTREHFEQDDDPEFPFVNPVPSTCKFISFSQISTHEGDYFVVKGKATKCSIEVFENEEADDEQSSSQHMENRLTVAKAVDLFCSGCAFQTPLAQQLNLDLASWLSSQDEERFNSFKCPMCDDETLAFTFNISFVVSDVSDEVKEEEEKEGEGPSTSKRKRRSRRSNKSKKKKNNTPVTFEAVLTGISAIMYFGQRPEDALISEYNSCVILKGIRAVFNTDDPNDSGIRWWYIVKLSNYTENTIPFDYSIITIVADESDTTDAEIEHEESTSPGSER